MGFRYVFLLRNFILNKILKGDVCLSHTERVIANVLKQKIGQEFFLAHHFRSGEEIWRKRKSDFTMVVTIPAMLLQEEGDLFLFSFSFSMVNLCFCFRLDFYLLYESKSDTLYTNSRMSGARCMERGACCIVGSARGLY